jgi:tetratricopeptide (TPR) repeat protein
MEGEMNMRRTSSLMLVLSVVFSLVAVAPQQIFAQTGKGIELYNSWDFKGAEKVLRDAIKADPSDTLANYHLGLALMGQQNYSEALDIFLKVKRSQDKADQWSRPAIPNEYQIQLATARARLGLKQYEEAWKNLESARIEDGSAADVYVYRGAYYVLQEKDREALVELDKAHKLDDQNAYAHYYMGLAYFHSGQASKAVEALKTFLTLAPRAPEAAKAKLIVDQLC